jgi:hypothetical protein
MRHVRPKIYTTYKAKEYVKNRIPPDAVTAVRVDLVYTWKRHVRCMTRIFTRNTVHHIEGFSFGYGGEGPRGLAAVLKMLGFDSDWPTRPQNLNAIETELLKDKGTVPRRIKTVQHFTRT